MAAGYRCGRGLRSSHLLLSLLVLGAAALLLVACQTFVAVAGSHWRPGGQIAHSNRRTALRSPYPRKRTQVAVSSTDTFDPWTVLGISPNAGVGEARKAYKKLISKYHPDVDPSTQAQEKFQQAVRAFAVVSGEDKDLDMNTLLKNAVENLKNDMEFKRQQIEKLKAKAKAEEEAILKMEDQMAEAEVKREKVTQELGAYGGATLGLLAAGPTGAIVGAVFGIAFKDRDDAFGEVLRGVGTVTKGLAEAATKTLFKNVARKEK